MSEESRLKELIAAHFRISVESVRETTDFYTDLEADVLDLPELEKWNCRLYNAILPEAYENSYANT